MNRTFNHFRLRLHQRFNITLSVDECEKIVSQIEKGIYLKSNLNTVNYDSIMITLLIKGKLLVVAYVPGVRYISTCLRVAQYHKEQSLANEIIEFQKWDNYLNRLKENNLKLESLCLLH